MRVYLIQPSAEHAESLVAEFTEFEDEVFLAGEEPAPGADVCVVCLDPVPDEALRLLAAMDLPAPGKVPLLFVGGDERALLRAHQLHPRASFTRPRELHSAIASLRA